ncbi:arsenate reductase ArsC [candidate division KSB1 bacterium]|nr:arsenate reductase ArsC [candidate division KSB1 bacterium]
MKKQVIIMCTGNSCRSQIAEGYLRHLARDKYNVVSAGLEPSMVNPRAIQVMAEHGIDISGHTSKAVDLFLNQKFDYIITVCDHAKERCPFFPGSGKRIHWSFRDPAAATGSETEIMEVFRSVRDQIRKRLIEFANDTD